jgi:hypothetical protein
MRQTMLMAIGCLLLSGCGGQFILIAPDPIAPAGQEAPMVVRLQRRDLFFVPAAVKDTCIRFQLPESRQAAITDRDGYAGVSLQAPQRPGIFPLKVAAQAREGEEILQQSRFYVWARDQTAIAVDLDGLPGYGSAEALEARSALVRLAARANLVYLTQRAVTEHPKAHAFLARCGYPDGPIVVWESKRWQMVNRGGLPVPEILWEGRMVSQLPLLRDQFPGLNVGICTGGKAAAGFNAANLRAIVVGDAAVKGDQVKSCRRWSDLPALGL